MAFITFYCGISEYRRSRWRGSFTRSRGRKVSGKSEHDHLLLASLELYNTVSWMAWPRKKDHFANTKQVCFMDAALALYC